MRFRRIFFALAVLLQTVLPLSGAVKLTLDGDDSVTAAFWTPANIAVTVDAIGSELDLDELNADNLTSGTVPTARLAASLQAIINNTGALNISGVTLTLPADVTRLGNSIDFATEIGGKPTTLAGYGITDPVVLTSGSYANPAWLTSLASAKVGLGSVDNTSDIDKPVSTSTQTALNLKAGNGANTDLTATKPGVTVTKSNGVQTFFQPGADTDAARFTALSAAFAAMTAGDTLEAAPGNYLCSAQLLFLAGCEYNLGKARLYAQTGGIGNSYYFSVGVPGTGADNVTIRGGEFDGNSQNFSYGGLLMDKSHNLLVIGARFHHWPQSNGAIVANSNPATKYPSCKFVGCNIDNNTIGAYLLAEFFDFVNCVFYLNGDAVLGEPGGNATFTGCHFNGSTNYGVRMKNGSNDSHWIFSGCVFAHNTGNSFTMDASADNGATLSGCHFYADNNSSGYIELNGSGFNMIGGILDAPVMASSTPTGVNVFDRVRIDSAFVSISELSVNERALVKFYDCYNPDGTLWINNDTALANAWTALTDGATVTITANAQHARQDRTLTIGGNRTLAFSGLTAGMSGTLAVTQDATGDRFLTLPAIGRNTLGGRSIPLSREPGAVNLFNWVYDGTNVYFDLGPRIRPLSISGCQIWLDASQLGLSNGTAVDSYKDISPNARHFTASGGARPTFTTNVQNSLPGVVFDGIDDVMTGVAAISVFRGVYEHTIFAVCKVAASPSGTTNSYDRPQIFTDIGGYHGFGVIPSGAGFKGSLWGYDTAMRDVQTGEIALNTVCLLEGVHLAGNFYASDNEVLPSSTTAGSMTSLTTSVKMGADYVSTRFLNGTICELIIYNRALSSAERAAVRGYLRAKYAL